MAKELQEEERGQVAKENKAARFGASLTIISEINISDNNWNHYTSETRLDATKTQRLLETTK